MSEKLSPEAQKILKKQRKTFIRKFGREPGRGDPVFFDPKSETPEPIDKDFDEAIMKALIEAEVRPELVYAYRKTGRIVNQEGYRNMGDEARAEWNAAIDEYFSAKREFSVLYRGQKSS